MKKLELPDFKNIPLPEMFRHKTKQHNSADWMLFLVELHQLSC